MKLLICLLATACTCNATFLNLLNDKGGSGGGGGGSHVTYSVVAAPSHGSDHSHHHSHELGHASSFSSHDHGHYKIHDFGNSPKIIKVILDQGHSGGHASSGSYSYAGGHSYGTSPYDHGDNAQIFKIISQNSVGPAPVYVDQGYSAGAAHGWASDSSYASGYNHASSYNYNSQLSAILPQILQLILEDDSGGHGDFFSGSNNDLNSQLIAHFGHKGKAFIKRSNGKTNHYYSGGHVVQKGHLQITRVEESPSHSAHGPPAHVYSSHGPPPHSHGW